MFFATGTWFEARAAQSGGVGKIEQKGLDNY